MIFFLYIAKTLGISRREAKLLIKKTNELFVNGETIRDPNYLINKEDRVFYQENELKYQEYFYVLLNKPQGYLCSLKDELYPSILNLIEDEILRKRLKIVGRLDVDTEGLIILTDDGDFIHQMTSPKRDVKKKYYVETNSNYSEEDGLSFSKGVIISDEKKLKYNTKEALLEIIEDNKAYLTITEGRFHQVKKMHKAIGKDVLFLKRIGVGEFHLGDLKTGEYLIIDNKKINKEEL